jgi:hypothetical protein
MKYHENVCVSLLFVIMYSLKILHRAMPGFLVDCQSAVLLKYGRRTVFTDYHEAKRTLRCPLHLTIRLASDGAQLCLHGTLGGLGPLVGQLFFLFAMPWRPERRAQCQLAAGYLLAAGGTSPSVFGTGFGIGFCIGLGGRLSGRRTSAVLGIA